MSQVDGHYLQLLLQGLTSFCTVREVDGCVIYEDKRQPDKYTHNFLLIQTKLPQMHQLLAYVDRQLENGFADIEVHHLPHLPTVLKWIEPYAYKVDTYQVMFAPIEAITLPPIKKDLPQHQLKQAHAHDSLFWQLKLRQDRVHGTQYAINNQKRIIEVMEKTGNPRYLYVQSDQTIIGYVAMHVSDGYLEIDDFEVDERYQKQGWGTRLIHEVMMFAKRASIHTFYLVADADDTPLHLYEKWGFRPYQAYVHIHLEKNK